MNPQMNAIDFNELPFIAIWEVTQACDLGCVHCRASAPHPAQTATFRQCLYFSLWIAGNEGNPFDKVDFVDKNGGQALGISIISQIKSFIG